MNNQNKNQNKNNNQSKNQNSNQNNKAKTLDLLGLSINYAIIPNSTD